MIQKSRKLTTIGLVLEGLLQAFLYFLIHLLINASNWTYSLLYQFFTGNGQIMNNPIYNLGETEGWFLIFIIAVMIYILFTLPIFLFNFFVFTKHMKSKYTLRGAKNVYTYQLVIGGTFVFFSGFFILPLMISGVMYLLSGYYGMESIKKTNQPKS